MKRAVLLILVLVLLIIPFSTNAANEVYIGINNAMLPLTSNMPFSSGGTWYMDYIDFTRGDLGLSASYNKNLGTAVLYNSNVALIFDLNSGTATLNDKKFNQKAIVRNGTAYLPVPFVCEQLGITYSYLSEVSTLRLVTTSSMSDSMFYYIAKNRIPDLLAEYNSSNIVSPQGPAIDSNLDDSRSQNVYVTVNIKNSADINNVLTTLDNYSINATLFLSKNAMQDDNLVRKVFASRHSIGIYAASIEEATLANNLLCDITNTKTRLLSNETKIIGAEEAGYRQWGCNIDALTRNATQINNALAQRDSTVLRFDGSAASITKMKRVFPNILSKKITVRTIDVIMTPVLP